MVVAVQGYYIFKYKKILKVHGGFTQLTVAIMQNNNSGREENFAISITYSYKRHRHASKESCIDCMKDVMNQVIQTLDFECFEFDNNNTIQVNGELQASRFA